MGEPRAGRWADTNARRAEWQVIRRIGWRLAIAVVAGCGLGLAVAFARPTVLGGFVAGIFVTATIAMAAFVIVQEAGTVARRAGGDAERFTSEALRPAVRAGWLRFDRVPFVGFDVDHVLIGPDVAYAIETKWSATAWTADDPRLEDFLRQARVGSRKVASLLRSTNVGHRVPVETVLVLWGAVDGLATDVVVDGVRILRGRELKDWARGRDRVAANRRTHLAGAAERLRREVAIRDQRNPTATIDEPRYVRDGPNFLADRLGWAALGAAAVAGTTVLTVSWSPWLGLGWLLTAGVAGTVIARRQEPTPPAAVGAALAGFGMLAWILVVVALAI